MFQNLVSYINIPKGQENPDFKLPACPFNFRIFRLLCPAGPEIVWLVRKFEAFENFRIQGRPYVS